MHVGVEGWGLELILTLDRVRKEPSNRTKSRHQLLNLLDVATSFQTLQTKHFSELNLEVEAMARLCCLH